MPARCREEDPDPAGADEAWSYRCRCKRRGDFRGRCSDARGSEAELEPRSSRADPPPASGRRQGLIRALRRGCRCDEDDRTTMLTGCSRRGNIEGARFRESRGSRGKTFDADNSPVITMQWREAGGRSGSKPVHLPSLRQLQRWSGVTDSAASHRSNDRNIWKVNGGRSLAAAKSLEQGLHNRQPFRPAFDSMRYTTPSLSANRGITSAYSERTNGRVPAKWGEW